MIFISYLRDMLIAAASLALAAGAGGSLLRLARVQLVGTLERWVISLALGFGLCSYLLFGLGSLGWLDLGAALFVLATAGIVGLPFWLQAASRRRIKEGWSRFQLDVSRWRRSPLLVVLGGLFVATALLNLIGALAPPTEWDSLDYHLSAVKYFIDHGRITFVPWGDWPYPFTAEMWNMLGLVLGSDRLPQLFQWSMGLSSAAALYLLAASRTSRRTALLAATIFYLSPFTFYLATSAKSDLAWLTFVFVSMHCLLVWRERGDIRWLWVSAVFVGLGMGTKYHGLFWAVAIGTALLVLPWASWRRTPWKTISSILAFGAIAVLVASPWLLRNWIAGGDPMWPYGYSIFHSRFWSQELDVKYSAWVAGPGESGWHYLSALWNLTIHQSDWLYGIRQPVSPVVLAFIPGIFLLGMQVPPRTLRFFGLLLVAMLVYYTIWFKTYQLPRYLFPGLALMMIPAAYVFWEINKSALARWATTAVLVSSLLLFLGYNLAFNLQFAPVVFGSESRDEFLARKTSFYEDIQWINNKLPPDARLLFYHLKTYYLERDFIRSDANIWPVDDQTTPEEYLRRLQEKRITHIFISELRRGEDKETDRILAELAGRQILVPIYRNPEGIWIQSRTLDESSRTAVEVFEVVYPHARASRTLVK